MVMESVQGCGIMIRRRLSVVVCILKLTELDSKFPNGIEELKIISGEEHSTYL